MSINKEARPEFFLNIKSKCKHSFWKERELFEPGRRALCQACQMVAYDI